MHSVFKFNRGVIVTNTSKYNLAEALYLKKTIKVIKNISCENLIENEKRYLICSTHKSVHANLQNVCVAL